MNFRETEVTNKIKKSISKLDPDADVILFGSHARGDANTKSDWDILILIENDVFSKKLEKKYRDEIYNVEIEIEEPISTLLYSKKEWQNLHSLTPLFANIKKEGIIL